MRKLSLMLISATIAASTFLPTQAQTKVDPQARTFLDKLSHVMNDHNAREGVSLFAQNAVLVDPFGNVSTGQSAETNFFNNAFKVNGNAKFSVTPIASHASGDMMWILAKARWTPADNSAGAKPLGTHIAYALVREDGTWKANMLSVGTNVPPPSGSYVPPASNR